MLRELPLVIFTLIAQMSVGSFVVLGLIHLFGGRAGRDVIDKVSDPALYAIGPILVVGLLASMMHLGTPIRAINALRHLDSSWLSREILFGLLFAAIGGAFAFTQWFKWLTPRLRQALAGLAAVVGLSLIWSMTMVYLLPTVPAWDSWATPARFFATTFLLGSLAVGAALVITADVRRRRGAAADEASDQVIMSSLRGITIGAIAMLGIEFVVLPLYLGQLATDGSAAATGSVNALVTTYGAYAVAQLVLVFLGVALLGVFLSRLAKRFSTARVLAIAPVAAFVLVFTGEIIGRMLFYASYARVGL
ncbi:MAG: dimethyl sulfoxide reductase anchor subunit [Dermatophilaceae bacterium]|nr:dimethyl sulfoxide reductase anchor subunit [Dermatophilaceae bacterium]